MEFPSCSCTATPNSVTTTQHSYDSEQGWAQSPKEKGGLALLPRKRCMKLYLQICIFILQTRSNLKSAADVIFQLVCLYVILGSKSLKNFCITWITVCIALCVILPCQLLLRNQDQSTVIERSNVSSYLLPFQTNPTQRCLEKMYFEL